MHDLHFSEILKLHSLGATMDPPLINSACIEAEKSYRDNYHRVLGLVTIPGMSFVVGEMWVATNEVFKTTTGDASARLVETYFFQMKALSDKVAGKDLDREFFAKLKRGTENSASFLSLREVHHTALHSLLQSVVILAWTAFEGLAEDLHSLSREHHSECFQSEVLGLKKYHFRRLDALPKSYSRAFGGDLSIIAQVENADVRALGLLRHLIVHKSGVVDQVHLDERAKPPVVNQLNSFGLNSTVELTGDLVSTLVNLVTLRAYGLLRSVDTWLAAHKPS